MSRVKAIEKHFFIKGVEYKKCNCCGEVKPISDFSKNKSSSDGLYTYCKVCAYKKIAESRAKKNKKDNNIKEGFKKCTICGEVKPVSEFYQNHSKGHGCNSACKSCENKARAERKRKAKLNTQNTESDISVSLSANKEEIRPDVKMYDNIVVLDHKCQVNDKNIKTVKEAIEHIDNAEEIDLLNNILSEIVSLKALIPRIAGLEEEVKVLSNIIYQISSKEDEKRKELLLDVFGKWIHSMDGA